MLKRFEWRWDPMFESLEFPEHPIFKRSEFSSYQPESQMFQMPRYGRSNDDTIMIPVARIGKRDDQTSDDNYYKSIPIPRIG